MRCSQSQAPTSRSRNRGGGLVIRFVHIVSHHRCLLVTLANLVVVWSTDHASITPATKLPGIPHACHVPIT